MVARIEMMVMTIINSSSENPPAHKPRRADRVRRRKFRETRAVMWKDFIRLLPLGIFRPVGRRRLGRRINIEDVASAPAGGIWVVLNGAQTPIRFTGHRVHRNFPQVAHLAGRGRHTEASVSG